jgi:crotonobetainyl-CoA:carnitine CoA-transferase CaiB-like acyl-CoA transferase
MMQMSLPLEGMRVLDLTRLLPGPYGTVLLADMGADVIKVEDPAGGDYLRLNPPHAPDGTGIHFHTINRNKRSITLDLKQKEGKELLVELAGWAEVLVEQFRPGVMERLGLGYETIKEVNPSIIYCSITGYGQDGPYRDVAGHDINYLGYAGVLGMSGHRGGPPVVSSVQIADLAGGGMFAALSVLMAYVHRQKTGEGQHLDVSMLDGSMSWLTINTGEYFITGEAPERGEQVLHGAWPCYDVYEAKDGYMSVGALEPKFWKRLCEIMGRPDYASEQFNPDMREDISGWLAGKFREKNRAQWMELLGSEDCCVGPILSLDETEADPQVKHRRMIVEVDDERLGRWKTLGIPVKFSRTPGSIRTRAPKLGEHTDEILQMLGCPLEEIQRLRTQGVVL